MNTMNARTGKVCLVIIVVTLVLDHVSCGGGGGHGASSSSSFVGAGSSSPTPPTPPTQPPPTVTPPPPPTSYNALTDTQVRPINFLIPPASASPPGAVRDASGTSVTLNLATPHGYQVGWTIVVTGMADSTFNVPYGGTITAVTSTSISYNQAGVPGAISGGGLVTAMPPFGPANTTITDPIFGTSILRVTDGSTSNNASIHTHAAAEANTWSADSSRFTVLVSGTGKSLVFTLDPANFRSALDVNGTANVSGVVPSMTPPSFSYTQANVLYTVLTGKTLGFFDFNTHQSQLLFDLGNDGIANPCQLPAPLRQTDSMDAITVDSETFPGVNERLAIASGGPVQNSWPFAIVWDGTNGCRWYNAVAGQMGGQWGPACGGIGQLACNGTPGPGGITGIHNVKLSRDGKYLIVAPGGGTSGVVAWDIGTDTVYPCVPGNSPCSGHRSEGYDPKSPNPLNQDVIFTGGSGSQWQIYAAACTAGSCAGTMGPSITVATRLDGGADNHSSWNNARLNTSIPVLDSSYALGTGISQLISQPHVGEIKAVSIDGSGIIWRFAHHYTDPFDHVSGMFDFFNTPRGNVDPGGRFFMFTSNWEQTLGNDNTCTLPLHCPRHDVFVIQLK